MEGNGMGLAIKMLGLIMILGVLAAGVNALGLYKPTEVPQVTPTPTLSVTPTVSVIVNSQDAEAISDEIDSITKEVGDLDMEIDNLGTTFSTTELDELQKELDQIK